MGEGVVEMEIWIFQSLCQHGQGGGRQPNVDWYGEGGLEVKNH